MKDDTIRGQPVQTKALTAVYAKILRAIHYRHEYARRHADVRKGTLQLLKELDVLPESVPAYFCPGGKQLVEVIAAAYRKLDDGSRGEALRGFLRSYFLSFRVLPVAPTGSPFFGEKLRLDPKSGAPRDLSGEYEWLKALWNSLLAFEYFAMAEFRLPRPIMLPMLPLPVVSLLKRPPVDIRPIPSFTNWAFPVFVDFAQSTDVIADYTMAIAEQAREGDLVRKKRSPVAVFKSKTFRSELHERYLDALDVRARISGDVDYGEKYAFCERSSEEKPSTGASVNSKFRDSLANAELYCENYRLLV